MHSSVMMHRRFGFELCYWSVIPSARSGKTNFFIRCNNPRLETREHNFEIRVKIYIQDAAVLGSKETIKNKMMRTSVILS